MVDKEGICFILMHLLNVFNGEPVEQGVKVFDLHSLYGRLESLFHVLGVEHGSK